MIKIVGVRFRTAGKIYYFGPKDFDLKFGDYVIVETARGTEIGQVAMVPREVTDDELAQPLRDIVRMASQDDIERMKRNREKEKDAYKKCREKIDAHGLEMKLVRAEYAFDNSKLLFYFTADGRIDFRELVKDLASEFHTRIELRQIGVRDETKLLGGMGVCGRELCCTTYLSDFAPVSIKMAKEQNLSLNPTKISGMCGRLMCCLKNEQETYEYLNKQLPRVGDIVETPMGDEGSVKSVNVLRQRVKVLIEVDDTKEEHEYAADEIKFISHKRPGNQQKQNNEKQSQGDGKPQADKKPQGENKQQGKKAQNENKQADENPQAENSQNGNQPQGEKKKKNNHRNRNRNRNKNKNGGDKPNDTQGSKQE